ncbi:substrate-binding domain-containing protein [Luteimicrobium sp. DT211]|uniref:LacI family DNA-binding transcriptional regulator n=1 Tax=Luteimicrobium sp. DT211 TaxID=3393412 RepID=UPI003CF801DA
MTDSRAPLPVTRRHQVLEELQRHGTVRVSDLTDVLGVSAITIRRDIAQLADEGLVERVHGGASLLQRGAAADDEEQPTPAANRLLPSGMRLGILVPSLDYYWPEVVQGAQEAASDLDMTVILRGSSYEAADERPQLRRLVERQGVDALVIAPRADVPAAAATAEWLHETGLPTVLVERTATYGPYHAAMESVVTDHALGAGMAVRHLADLGHERIGVVVARQSPTAPHVHRGWLEAMSESGLDVTSTVDAAVPDSRAAAWDAELDAILDRCLETRTTALLVHADPEAMALVQRWEDRGLTVPGDLSVVAYDDEAAGLFSPPLTAVRPPRRSIGRAAVELAAARLADPDRPAHRVVISPSLRVRKSTAAPASA